MCVNAGLISEELTGRTKTKCLSVPPEGLRMPATGGEPEPSVVVLHPEHARPPTDSVMTFIAMMSHPLRGWSL
jgi:hypothetical protein